MWEQLFLHRTDATPVHLLRAALSSVIAFGLDFSILILLTERLHLYYLFSAAAGFVVGTTLNYLLNVHWVFSRRRLSRRSLEYSLFLLVGVGGLAWNELLLWTFTEPLGIYYLVSRILAGMIVFSWNFFIRKVLLFR